MFDWKSASVINYALNGGAGDILYKCAALDQAPAYIKPLRKLFPNLKTRALICSVTNGSPEIFENNPDWDECSYHVWSRAYKTIGSAQGKGFPFLLDAADTSEGVQIIPLFELPDGIKPERLGWYLDPSQKAVLAEIAGKPYVALHLYAGDAERCWAPILGNAGC